MSDEMQDQNVEQEQPVEETEQEPETEQELEDEDLKTTEQESDSSEEDEEEPTPSKYHRPTFKEIKSKFPNFFKEFPEMREVYFREREFTNLFPTVEDAQEAFNQSVAFQAIERDLRQGSVSSLIQALSAVDPEATERLAENFLYDVYERSPDLYYRVLNPILERFVKAVYDEGQRTNNESYKAAALYFSQFAWGHTDIDKLGKEQPQRVDPKLEQEKQKLIQQRAQIESQRYQEVHSQVSARAQKLLLNEIVKDIAGVKFDNNYVRDSVVRDIFSRINEVLTADSNHMRLMHSLWQKAYREGFSPESRNRLVTTLLARAKRIMPAIRKEIISQLGKNEEEEVQKPVGGKVTPMQTQQQKVDWSKYKSDTDFLNEFVARKKR